MDTHYKLTNETLEVDGHTLYRIEATKHFKTKWGTVVSPGELGGWVESTKNLIDNAWVADEAKAYGDTVVSENSTLMNTATATGQTLIGGNAVIGGNATVKGNTTVLGNVFVIGDSVVSSGHFTGDAILEGKAVVDNDTKVFHMPVLTSQHLNLTMTHQEGGKHLVSVGCWSGTVDELEELFKRDSWLETCDAEADEAREEMLTVCQLLRARIARWSK